MKNRKTLKKLILGGLLLLTTGSVFAQTQKVHTLQAKNSSGTTTMNSDALIQMDSDNKGLLLPRIALTGANQVAPLTAHTAGMVVYNTATVAASGTGATAIEEVTPGYYYNNGTKWVKIANTDTADITDDAWVNNTTTNVVELATKSDGTARTAGTEMLIKDNGKVEINGGNVSLYGTGEIFSTFNSYVYGNKSKGTSYGGFKARGTRENPTYPLRGDNFVAIVGRDIIDEQNINGYGGAAIYMTAVEDFSLNNKGTEIAFHTTKIGKKVSRKRVVIANDGSVGIGTGTPQKKLDVKGNVKFDNGGSHTHLTIGSDAHDQIISDNNASNGYGGGYFFRVTGAGGTHSDVLHITETSNVGIGVPIPTEKLEVAGNGKFTGTVSTTGVLTTSDKRFKQGVTPVSSAMQTVNKLQPVSYTWSALGKKNGGDNKKHIGFIAQEVEKVLPNLVNTNAKGYKSVNYIEVIPVLTKALQEQQKAIKKQQKEIDELKAMVKKLLK